MTSLDQLTSASFSSFIGALFDVQLAPGTSAQAELVSVTPFKSQPANTCREPFSLLFRVAGYRMLEQRIYRLSNEQFGEAEIFLVPVGCDQRGVQMEAVFN